MKTYRTPIKTYRKPIKTYRTPIKTYRKPYKVIGFRDDDGRFPYEFIGFPYTENWIYGHRYKYLVSRSVVS